jgi:hypothetical protein
MAQARLKKSFIIIFEAKRYEWDTALSRITNSLYLSDAEARSAKIALYLNFKNTVRKNFLSKVQLISWDGKDSYFGFAPNKMFSSGDPNAYTLFELNIDTLRGKITLISLGTGEMRQKTLKRI